MTRLSVLAGAALIGAVALAGPGLADDHGWKHRHKHKHHFVPPGRVYVVERPVFVEQPMSYSSSRSGYRDPGYYGPPPPPSINFNIPLY
jgi:hypothetical protein